MNEQRDGLLVIRKGAAGGGGTGVLPVFIVEMEPATQGGRPLAPAPCWSHVSLAQMPCVPFQKPCQPAARRHVHLGGI